MHLVGHLLTKNCDARSREHKISIYVSCAVVNKGNCSNNFPYLVLSRDEQAEL